MFYKRQVFADMASTDNVMIFSRSFSHLQIVYCYGKNLNRVVGAVALVLFWRAGDRCLDLFLLFLLRNIAASDINRVRLFLFTHKTHTRSTKY
jgi:hypothetical protein